MTSEPLHPLFRWSSSGAGRGLMVKGVARQEEVLATAEKSLLFYMCCLIEILTWPNKGEKIDRYHCKFTSLYLASNKVQFSIIKILNVIYQQHLIYSIANVSAHKCVSPFTRLSRHLVVQSCLQSFILVHFPGEGHFHLSNV